MKFLTDTTTKAISKIGDEVMVFNTTFNNM